MNDNILVCMDQCRLFALLKQILQYKSATQLQLHSSTKDRLKKITYRSVLLLVEIKINVYLRQKADPPSPRNYRSKKQTGQLLLLISTSQLLIFCCERQILEQISSRLVVQKARKKECPKP
jgi:hypothetical protein